MSELTSLGPDEKEVGQKESSVLTLEGLRVYAEAKFGKLPAEKVVNKDILGRYPDIWHVKLEGGFKVDVQIAGDEKEKDQVTIDGKKREVLARVWVTNKNADEPSAWCYRLTRNEAGEEVWLVQKSNVAPDHNKEKKTNYWELDEVQKAEPADKLILSAFLQNAS